MEGVVLLDTHAVVWLYTGEIDRFPVKAQAAMQQNSLEISPMVELELKYLQEIKRLKTDPKTIIGDLATRVGLQLSHISLGRATLSALDLSWTHDPFDRLIAGHAMTINSPLITKDKIMRKHVPKTIWD